MIAVKAYYDGKSFVPLGNITFKLKQSAIVVVDEENDSDEKSVSCRGLAFFCKMIFIALLFF